MTPAPRDLPIVLAYGPRPDRSYVVALPGSVQVVAPTRLAVEELVKKHASGSAIRYVAWVIGDRPRH